MPVSTSVNQQTTPLAWWERRKQQGHRERAAGLRLFCQTLYFSLKAALKPLCPLAFFVHLSCQDCASGKQIKCLTHRLIYMYKVSVCSTHQEETNNWKKMCKAVHNPLGTVTLQRVPTEITCLLASHLPFTAEPP